MISEKDLEDWFVQQLEKTGWTFELADTLPRNNLRELLLESRVIEAVQRINHDVKITQSDIQRVLNEIKWISPTPDGCSRMLEFLKKGVPIKTEKERITQYVHLIDFENISMNQFTVTRQITLHGPNESIRMDVLLYVNGIPIVNIELKDPTSSSEDYKDALGQIRNYWNIGEYGKFVQIGVGSEQVSKYIPIVPWQKEIPEWAEWRKQSKDVESILKSNDSMIEMVKPTNLLNIIQNYLFIRRVKSNATKVLPRYVQFYAAERIVERIINNQLGKETKNKGLIWHWQGSGKTLTMIFAANKLLNHPTMENPTVLFILDRDDLQNQLERELTGLDIPKPQIIESIQGLKEFITHDEYKGKRGFIITLIHKFSPSNEGLKEVTHILEELSKQKETIVTRKNIVGFIDEGHRTQYGLLAAQMRKVMPNAYYFAFTGTPIEKTGHNTYSEFSYPPDEPYLDRYFITESIRDGFTLPIIYLPRLENENIHLKRDQINAFLEAEEDEITEDIQGEIKRKLSVVNVFLENPKRIAVVAKDITAHFNENIHGKFKAMIVACSRKACVSYKRELDKLLPPEYSEIVMTYNPKSDSKEIREYTEELQQKYGPGLEMGEIDQKIVEDYHRNDNPQILIVTDMLLTGFDSKILQTMYLDKPLKGHRLLQAVARTNRTMGEVKGTGRVVDYVGIFSEYEKALRNYAEEDVKGAIQNIDELRSSFKKTVEEGIDLFSSIVKGNPKEYLDEITRYLMKNGEISKKFIQLYRKARRQYEALGSDVTKLDYQDKYEFLTEVAIYYLRALRRNEAKEEFSYLQKYFTKTLKMIQSSVEIKNIEKNLPEIEFGYDYLQKLEERVKNKEQKAANIVFTLNRMVLVDRHRTPMYESLIQKVERLVNSWKDKTKDYESIYNEGARIIRELNQEEKRKNKLGFNDVQFGMLLTLEEKLLTKKNGILADSDGFEKDIKELYNKLEELLFESWQTQPSTQKEVEQIIRTFLRRYITPWKLSYDDYEVLFQKTIDVVKKNA